MGFFSGFGFGDIVKSVAGPLTGGLFSAFDKPKADYSGAQNQISWRVADAKRAGIHPLAALGVPSMGPVVNSSNVAPWAADAASNLASMRADRDLAALSGRKLESEVSLNNALRAEAIARTSKTFAEQLKMQSDISLDRARANNAADQAYRYVYGPDGEKYLVGNNEVLPDPEVEIWDTVKRGGRQVREYWRGISKWNNHFPDITNPNLWRK